jgi:hypothetical protein
MTRAFAVLFLTVVTSLGSQAGAHGFSGGSSLGFGPMGFGSNPGFIHPGFVGGNPGFGHSGFVHPRFIGHPGFVAPGFRRPGFFVHPGFFHHPAIFRPVGRGGRVSAAPLSGFSAAEIVKHYATRAGLDPAPFREYTGASFL